MSGTDYGVNQQLMLHHLAYRLCGLRRSAACCSVAGDSSVATVRSSVCEMFLEVVGREDVLDISVLRALCLSLGHRCRRFDTFSDILNFLSLVLRNVNEFIVVSWT